VGPYAEVKSSDFNLRLKMLRELADLLFSEREFQTAGALTEKALADTFTPFFYLAELTNMLLCTYRFAAALVPATTSCCFTLQCIAVQLRLQTAGSTVHGCR